MIYKNLLSLLANKFGPNMMTEKWHGQSDVTRNMSFIRVNLSAAEEVKCMRLGWAWLVVRMLTQGIYNRF
jgi:hypothetical protein